MQKRNCTRLCYISSSGSTSASAPVLRLRARLPCRLGVRLGLGPGLRLAEPCVLNLSRPLGLTLVPPVNASPIRSR